MLLISITFSSALTKSFAPCLDRPFNSFASTLLLLLKSSFNAPVASRFFHQNSRTCRIKWDSPSRGFSINSTAWKQIFRHLSFFPQNISINLEVKKLPKLHVIQKYSTDLFKLSLQECQTNSMRRYRSTIAESLQSVIVYEAVCFEIVH